MIVGAGIDIVEIARVERALERRGNRIRERLFTPRERADCERGGRAGPRFALRFAAKEAGMKAIGTGWRRGVGWRDFETTEQDGSLGIEIHGRALDIARELGAGEVVVETTGSSVVDVSIIVGRDLSDNAG